ncbi:hypothetical protein LCGC14_3058120, partial [marine sediment metagenome]
MNFASVGSGQILELQRSGAVGELGEIVRVGLIVVTDPGAAVGAQVLAGGVPLGVTTGQDNLPSFVIRRVERQLRATYELNDPRHTHQTTSRTISVRPTFSLTIDAAQDIVNGTWFSVPFSFDGNAGTRAVLNNQPSETNHLLFNSGAALPLQPGEVVQNVRLQVVTGGENFVGNFDSGTMDIRIMQPGAFPSGGGSVVDGLRVQVPFSTVPRTDSSSTFNGDPFPSGVPFGDLLWVVKPTGTVNPPNGTQYAVRDMQLVMTIGRPLATASTGIRQRRSVANFFDATNLAGGDFSFFTDPARG